ncbi:adenylyl-sulfate kinase 3-like [Dorcoceras hygrometricum]|uniref:Adenylyl-sulfate kinase 3-like n=1 Tax=Dorcoceras hygrometricum TaxID=472368 RepID=A0A2Z7D983_9LAMI|nr:adenylyl-sulfate kinase 3-like [Dorcoceras hygrometricum]
MHEAVKELIIKTSVSTGKSTEVEPLYPYSVSTGEIIVVALVMVATGSWHAIVRVIEEATHFWFEEPVANEKRRRLVKWKRCVLVLRLVPVARDMLHCLSSREIFRLLPIRGCRTTGGIEREAAGVRRILRNLAERSFGCCALLVVALVMVAAGSMRAIVRVIEEVTRVWFEEPVAYEKQRRLVKWKSCVLVLRLVPVARDLLHCLSSREIRTRHDRTHDLRKQISPGSKFTAEGFKELKSRSAQQQKNARSNFSRNLRTPAASRFLSNADSGSQMSNYVASLKTDLSQTNNASSSQLHHVDQHVEPSHAKNLGYQISSSHETSELRNDGVALLAPNATIRSLSPWQISHSTRLYQNDSVTQNFAATHVTLGESDFHRNFANSTPILAQISPDNSCD